MRDTAEQTLNALLEAQVDVLYGAIIERYRRPETSVEEALMEMYLVGVFLYRNTAGVQIGVVTAP
jgi:hypothetical protein